MCSATHRKARVCCEQAKLRLEEKLVKVALQQHVHEGTRRDNNTTLCTLKFDAFLSFKHLLELLRRKSFLACRYVLVTQHKRPQQLPPHQPTQSKHNQVVFVGCCDTFAGFALGQRLCNFDKRHKTKQVTAGKLPQLHKITFFPFGHSPHNDAALLQPFLCSACSFHHPHQAALLGGIDFVLLLHPPLHNPACFLATIRGHQRLWLGTAGVAGFALEPPPQTATTLTIVDTKCCPMASAANTLGVDSPMATSVGDVWTSDGDSDLGVGRLTDGGNPTVHTRNVALSFLCVAVLQILHNPCCTSTCPSYPPSHHTAPDLALRPMLVGFTSDVATASDSDAGLMALRQTTVQAGPVARTWGQLLQHSSPAAPPTTATAATAGALSHNAVKIAQPQPQPQPQSQSFMALFESARAAIGGSASFGSAASLQQLPLAHRGSSLAAMPTPPPTPCMSPCSLLRDRPDSESSDDDDDGYLEDEEDSSSARYCRPTLDCVVLPAQHRKLTHTPLSLPQFLQQRCR